MSNKVFHNLGKDMVDGVPVNPKHCWRVESYAPPPQGGSGYITCALWMQRDDANPSNDTFFLNCGDKNQADWHDTSTLITAS